MRVFPQKAADGPSYHADRRSLRAAATRRLSRDLDEEPLEGASRTAWRRVATFVHLPAISAKGSTQQMVPVEPASLEAALDKDRRQS